MKKTFLSLLSLFILVLCLNASAQEISRPKLVVGIVVDQMRWDYLYRYQARYGNGGFNRLLNQGYSYDNTFISHLPSFTAVGHSTIYTGSVPAIHGITGNNWVDQQTGKNWYCTEDTTVQTVGSSTKAGEMSPRNLLASTITDELRLATNFRSKVVGVSLKDRAAILPAGHAANGAFWFDDEAGKFVTSTYYMKDLPDWVKQFNAKHNPEKLVSAGWKTLYPVDTYKQSSDDQVDWEGKFNAEKTTTFPHDVAAFYKKKHETIRSTPFGNTLTLNFAKAALDGYHLGEGEFTDFLTVNCASTDYVGHMFGPNSVEAEDTYLRLDKDLAAFLSYLDNKVGKGNYLVFLTADHGSAHAVDFLQAHKLPGDILNVSGLMKQLNVVLAKQFGVEKLIISGLNYHVNYDLNKISSNKLDFEKIKALSVNFLKAQAGVQFAIDLDHIGEGAVPEPLKEMIVNGYNPKRAGSVVIIPEPGWFEGSRKGTTHGNWNAYDTHIPLVFMGWGIGHGSSNKTCHMTDIAPSIAALLHIQMPNGTVGNVLSITETTSKN